MYVNESPSASVAETEPIAVVFSATLYVLPEDITGAELVAPGPDEPVGPAPLPPHAAKNKIQKPNR